MLARHWLLASVVLIASALLGFACAATDAPIGATAEAGIPDVTRGEDAWGSTPCAACTFTACRQERIDCRAEPGCARNLDCVEACPAIADGDPEPSCVARCPLAMSTAAETARLALQTCRVTGRATTCAECPEAGRRRYRNPLLTSVCENPTFDAGLDPTPVQVTCSKCISERCCDARAACRADPGCPPLQDCYGACKDHACEDACYAQYDGSIGHLFGLFGCANVRCPKECGRVDKACSACLFDSCSDAALDCQSDHDCFLLGQCIVPCGTGQECVAACNAKFPAAIKLFEAQVTCALGRCLACR